MFELEELNELQLQRLVRSKSSLKATTVRALHEGLDRLVKSTRFELLSSLPLSNFQFEGRSNAGPVEKLTLGELVQNGAIKLSSLPSMGDQRVRAVVGVIDKLLEESESETNGLASEIDGPATAEELFDGLLPEAAKLSSENVTPIRLKKTNPSSAPAFISIKTEQDFLSALERLGNFNNLDKVRNKPLGDFWSEGEVRAPFEECLTFQQILSIQVDTLLRKRSLNERKLKAIIKAIDLCIEQESEVPVEHANKGASSSGGSMIPVASGKFVEAWTSSSDISVPVVLGVLTLIENLPPSEDVVTLLDALGRLPKLLKAKEALVLMTGISCSHEQAAMFLQLRPEEYGHHHSIARERMAVALKSDFSRFATTWNGLQGGVGASWDSLVTPFLVRERHVWLQEALALVLLECSGVRPWKHKGDDIEDLLTSDPERLIDILGLIAKSLPKTRQEFQRECELLLSCVKLKDCERIFKRFARFDPGSNVWEKL